MLDLLLSGDFNTFIKEFLSAYGYYAILLLTFLEGETIVLLAGAVAATTGALNPWLVVLCAFTGSCTSDQIMFCIGKYFGPKALKRFPRLNNNVDRVSGLIKKYDILLILGFRFVYGVRNITPIMLGITRVHHLKFLLLNIVGALVWAASFTAAGFYTAKGFNKFRELFGTTALYIILIILGLTALILYIRYRQNKKKALELAEKGRKALQEAQTNANAEGALPHNAVISDPIPQQGVIAIVELPKNPDEDELAEETPNTIQTIQPDGAARDSQTPGSPTS